MREPTSGLPSDGFAGSLGGSCDLFNSAPSVAALQRYIRERQLSPSDCRWTRQRFMIVDDPGRQETSQAGTLGMGFSAILMSTLLYQAMAENRTLLATSSVLRNHRWAWCDDSSRDTSCYFEPFTRCEAELVGLSSMLRDDLLSPSGKRSASNHSRAIVRWRPARGRGNSPGTLHARVVRVALNEGVGTALKQWTRCVPRVGRSFWYAFAAWHVLLRFRPWVERRALEFLADHGVRLHESHTHPQRTGPQRHSVCRCTCADKIAAPCVCAAGPRAVRRGAGGGCGRAGRARRCGRRVHDRALSRRDGAPRRQARRGQGYRPLRVPAPSPKP